MMFEQIQLSLDPSNLLAVAIALFALAVSIWQVAANRPKLKVVVNFGPLWDGQSSHLSEELYLIISTFNRGVQPTTVLAINSVVFRTVLDRLLFRYEFIGFGKAGPNSTPIPFELSPGREHRFHFLINEKTVDDFLKRPHFVIDVHHTWSDRPKRKALNSWIKKAAIKAWQEAKT